MKHRLITLLIALLVVPMSIIARNFDLSITNASPEAAFQVIHKATGYEFVYNKSILANSHDSKVTGIYKNMSLEQILNKVVVDQLGLAFEVVDKTIILSKQKPGANVNKVIKGVVVDEEGQPLPGASVIVKGTTNGVSTNIDGEFSLNVGGNNPVLQVTYVGMHSNEYHLTAANSSKPLRIVLRSNASLMNEVVVTGYQNLKRENATGSFQTVTSKDLDRSYTGTMTDRLEGKVPGLVTYDDGYGQKMTIRGQGSFQANTQPLIVVDGLPIEGGIESVNPYDIEKITVLKDAAAASIYGARAANGVIVISTKRATSSKVSIDFNTDITISEKENYDNFGWASAAEIIELEKYNFDYIKNQSGQRILTSLLNSYNSSPTQTPSVMKLFLDNHLNRISDAELNSQLDRYASNDYRQEYLDNFTHSNVKQNYNLALRVNGKSLASSIVLNYNHDNTTTVGNSNSAITFKYRGDLTLNKYLNLALGANVISERGKDHYGRPNIHTFSPIYSMFNADGTFSDMTEGIYNTLPSMSDSSLGLKSMFRNPLSEINMNPINSRRTNIRTYLQATAKILDGWTASGMMQYEDIYFKRNTYREGESFAMRELYNKYTAPDGTHYIPDGGWLDHYSTEGAYWTFRAQTNFNRTLWGKHDIDAVFGFEYRDNHDKTLKNILLGYDDQTQQDKNAFVDFGAISRMNLKQSGLGKDYKMSGGPDSNSFGTTDILHRFYSVYFNANYVYDTRYSISGSWRIDKTDLFGADPKFRGRPLWSVGASWNAHNETFLRDIKWISTLKPRLSYGLTGNIDSSVSSYLVAAFGTNSIYGNNVATLQNPPNDQLRWEKTSTWNFGLDFAFLNYRLSGSVDYFHKKGSDLLCSTDLDPTNGVKSATINNGECLNKGFEIQLNGHILEARSRNQLGINAYLNMTFNSNKILYVNKAPTNGLDAIQRGRLHKDYPISGLFSYDYAGIEVNKAGMQYVLWRDHEGEVRNSSILTSAFTVDDVVYGGSLEPKFVGTFTPEIHWQGFSISAMMVYYGGHVMRVNTDDFTGGGSNTGYSNPVGIEAFPSSYLDYWRTGDTEKYLGNGAASNNIVMQAHRFTQYGNNNIVPADFFKLRNIVVGYTLPNTLTRRVGINEARIRVQMNNVAKWVRNDAGKDPEAVIAFSGKNRVEKPRSYTFSIFLNF